MVSNRERTLFAIWAVVAALAIGVQLGGYPLLDADEGRNGEVGREMAATNDYVMPRLDALPYLDKPIVYFAAEAAAMEILGPTEFAARLPAWLFTIATAMVVFWFASRVGIDPAPSAIILLSMPLTVAFARTVIFDSALSLFITVAMIAFYLAVEEDKRWSAVAWAAIGFGVITKGPVAIALPLIVAIPYATWRRRFRALGSLAGLLLFIIVIAPWVWAISRAVPDFLRYVLVTETAQRLTTGAFKRTGPPWYFIPYLIGGAFPWSIAVLEATWSRLSRRLEPAEKEPAEKEPAESRLYVYLILWIAVPFILFSLSQSKRPQYILPLMPAIALLVARQWRSRGAAIALAIFGALLGIAVSFVKLRVEYAGAARSAALMIGIAALLCGVAAWVRPKIALIAMSIPILIIPMAANPLMNALALRRSTKAFVSRLPPREVIGIRAFTGSMAFYLRRPIAVVTPDGEEFTSNYIIRHYSRFADDAAGTLKPMSWLPQAFDRDAVLIVRDNDRAMRMLVERHGGRTVTEGAHFVAYTMPR